MSMTRESKLIVFVAVLASLLEIVDTSIVNVAIPTMMGNLGATLEDISMVITGYAIANAIVLPLSAWLGDRIGRRRYYLACIALFTITSVACGLAPNLHTLIVFRILQGLFGGALLPTSQALIYEQFPKEKAGMAGAIFGMSVMVGPTLGPTLGGWLTDNFGWRSIFNINLPLGMLALFVGSLVIRDLPKETAHAPGKKPGIDAWGLMALTAGIGCLQYVLERGEADDWFASDTIKICALIAAVALPFFVWWELRVKNPIINLRLFLDPIVRNGTMLMFMLGFALYSLIFVLPVFAGRTLHLDATQTGMLFIPGSLITMAVMPFVGKQLAKRDPRILIAIGFLSLEGCIYMMTRFTPLSSESEILHALYVRGIAMGFLFVPINSTILSQFKGLELGQVAGLMNLCRQIGGSVGVALVGTLLTKNSAQNYLDITSHVSMLNPNTQAAFQGMISSFSMRMQESVGNSSAYLAALKMMRLKIENQVFMLSYVQLMWTIGIIMTVSFIPLVLLKLRAKPAMVADSH